MKKIDAMHARFGVIPDKKCEDCSNLISGRYRTRYLSKCTVYGVTNSEATDWKKRNMACGLFHKEWQGSEMMRVFQSERMSGKQQIDPIDGQMEMEL